MLPESLSAKLVQFTVHSLRFLIALFVKVLCHSTASALGKMDDWKWLVQFALMLWKIQETCVQPLYYMGLKSCYIPFCIALSLHS